MSKHRMAWSFDHDEMVYSNSFLGIQGKAITTTDNRIVPRFCPICHKFMRFIDYDGERVAVCSGVGEHYYGEVRTLR